MKIDISNTSAEVESLRQIVASLQHKNEEWSSKYKKLEQEKSELSANHSKLSSSHITLHTRYSELESNHTELLKKNTELSNYIALLEERLRLLKAKRFGKSSEKLERQIDVVERLLEEEESLLGFNLKPGAASKENTQEKGKAKRKKLPSHLPREEVVLEPEAKCDSCGGKSFRKIGEEVSEILERIPESYKVIRYIRPRCACTNCDNIVQAYTPSKVIDKGIAGPGLLADIFVNKFSNHLPAYRQSQMFEREGIDISRSTISSWLGQGAQLLEPIADLIREYVISCNQIHGDDTPVKVLNPGTKKTKTGRMWVYVNDGRPRGDDSPIAAGYYYSPDRKGERPEKHLKDFTGILHADAYAGYNNLYKSEENPEATVEEVCCWAHVRRKFYDIIASNDKANIAHRIIDKIGEIYHIESTIRGMSPDVRLKTRKEKSEKLVNELFTGLKKAYKQLPKKSSTAKAIAYTVNNEVALKRFLGNGNIEIDNNAAERALRSVAVGRKNWLFAGSDKGGKTAAIIYTILETAKLNNINPVKYLHKVFDIIQDYKSNKLQDLLPWNIKLE
jgi:transposase